MKLHLSCFLALILFGTGPRSQAGPAEDRVPAATNKALVNSLEMRLVPVKEVQGLICIWETRVKDFDAFVTATGRRMVDRMWVSGNDGWKERAGYDLRNPGFPQTPDHPVVGVSWND